MRLNQMFSGRVLKRLLLIVCFFLLAAFIWLIGPYLGFGEARPLESVSSRVILISAFLTILLGLWFRVPSFIPLAVVACALVWIITPYILIGENYPLRSTDSRVIAIGIIILITLLWGIWKLIVALVNNPKLLSNLIKKRKLETGTVASQSEIDQALSYGVSYVRRINRSMPFWRRFLFTDQWQFQLPWFMVIGTENAGKTSMIFSSGQEFPLPEQLNRKDKVNSSTKHCECLFTNNAVFLDTSGKYITQGAESRMEWLEILRTLKKYRPEQAINGVIVTLSADDILNKDRTELLTISATIRMRLDELRQDFGIRFPVYVTITKLDQLSGFEEYFRNLTTLDREQIWGVTFPYDVVPTREAFDADKLKEHIVNELTLLEERINDAMNSRQQEEYVVNERKRMYAISQDFHLLVENVAEVLQNIFFSSQYDETRFYSSLRGIYFLSNRQYRLTTLRNNCTLMQRWQNVVENIHPLTPASLCHTGGDKEKNDLLITNEVFNKNYFLKRLFSDVITQDSHLVSFNLKVKSKNRLQIIAGHIVAIFATIWLISSLATSYKYNNAYLQSLRVKLSQLGVRVSEYVKKPGVELLPVLLGATQNLAQYPALDLSDPDIEWRYGLYTGNRVARGTNSLYLFFLQRYLLPQLEVSAEKALNDALTENNDDAIYQALKAYLMLFGAGKLQADYLISRTVIDWEKSGDIGAYGEKQVFINHLSALFVEREWRRYGHKVNDELVKDARATLAQKTETARIWSRLRSELQLDIPDSLTLGAMVGDQSSQVLTLNDEKLLRDGIPIIYTRDAYQGVVKKKILAMLATLQNEDSWVTGKKTTTLNPVALRDGIMINYFQEYTRYWKRFLASVRLISISRADEHDVSLDIALIRTLIGENSPLRNLVNRAARETTLAAKKEQEKLPDLQISQSYLVNQAKQIKEAVDYHEQRLVKRYLDENFTDLRNFVGGSRADQGKDEVAQLQGTPLNNVFSLLNDQYTRYVVYNSTIGTAGQGELSPLSQVNMRAMAELQTWPDPVKKVVEPLLTSTERKVEQQLIDQNVASINSGIGEVCRQTLEGRYPFANSKKMVSLSDFERFFAAGGLVDNWYRQNLMDKVDTSVRPWRYKGTNVDEGLAFFEKVDAIRNAFFPGGSGDKVALNFSAAVNYISPSITQLVINIGGQDLRYSHGPITPRDFVWPTKADKEQISIALQKKQLATLPDRIFHGPWAILQWLDAADEVSKGRDGNYIYTWFSGSERMDVAVSEFNSGREPLKSVLSGFSCPDDVQVTYEGNY